MLSWEDPSETHIKARQEGGQEGGRTSSPGQRREGLGLLFTLALVGGENDLYFISRKLRLREPMDWPMSTQLASCG